MNDYDEQRISKLIRRAKRLRLLYSLIPCNFTFGMLKRQIDALDEAVPHPRSHLPDTFGRLRFETKHPVALIHDARIKKEAKEARNAAARARTLERLAQMAAWANDRSAGSGQFPD